MLYTIVIPAQFAAAVAAGEVALMTTAAGATTTLVTSGGTIVGTATLVSAGATAAPVAATGVGIGFGTLLAATGIGLAIIGVIGAGCWILAEDQKRKESEAMARQAPEMKVIVEGTEEDARAVLAEVEALIDQAHSELLDREQLKIINSSDC